MITALVANVRVDDRELTVSVRRAADGQHHATVSEGPHQKRYRVTSGPSRRRFTTGLIQRIAEKYLLDEIAAVDRPTKPDVKTHAANGAQ